MKIGTKALLGWLLLVASFGSWALDLEQAKTQGLVGERPDGYLEALPATSPPDVKALVEAINRQRQEKYRQIADRNGIALDTVERLAGEKAINKSAPGHFVQLPSGQWVRK